MYKYLRLTAVLFLIAFVVPLTSAAEGTALEASPPVRGRVLAVEANSAVSGYEEEWETQLLTIRLTSGPNKNETITLLNTLTGHPYFDLRVKKGDRVVLEVDQLSDEFPRYYLADFSRRRPLWSITILFMLSIALIGGRQGLKAILSLLVMGLVIVFMILPLILRGYNPILVTVGLASALTGLFILLLSGYSKKTLAAAAGTVGGLIVAGFLAYIVGKTGYLTGLSAEEAQTLHFMNGHIDFQGVLFSGMIIGALGAILDVGISIASAMEQINAADPETDFQTLFTRGLLVGRDLIATMSNTLILAYVGSALPLLLLVLATESSWGQILNTELMATEIVRAMAGSIGLTLAIPITAFVSALLFVQPQHKSEHLSH